MTKDIFVFNNSLNKVELNEDLFLIREFKALTDINRNKCKEDPTGSKRLLAWREFKYIYLMLD